MIRMTALQSVLMWRLGLDMEGDVPSLRSGVTLLLALQDTKRLIGACAYGVVEKL